MTKESRPNSIIQREFCVKNFFILALLFFINLLSWQTCSAQCSVDIVQNKELLINDLSVVNDTRATQPNGPWTFGYLIRQIAPPKANLGAFVLRWLNQWKEVNNINGFAVIPRPQIDGVIADWPKLNGTLDVDHAPMRLLAIVNRIDLRTPFTQGGAGEGRFIFGVTNKDGKGLPFTVIFEFLLPYIPARNLTLSTWANAWHKLGQTPFGPAFNTQLQSITDNFSKRNSFPGRMNNSALNQVRTDETALANSWELREFRLDQTGFLTETTTVQTPAATFNLDRLPELVSYIQGHQAEILNETYILPRNSLGGTAASPTTWADGLSKDPVLAAVRHKLAVNTCNGCHTVETASPFVHVGPREAMVPSFLSKFVLEDLGRRATTLSAVLCGAPQSVPRLNRVD